MTAVQAAGVSRNVSRSTVPHSDGPGPQPPRPRGQRPATMLTRHDDLIERLHTGPYDELPAPEVLALLLSLQPWQLLAGRPNPPLRGASAVLDWLSNHPGTGWQQRWRAAGCDSDLDWIGQIGVGGDRSPATARAEILAGLTGLLLCRVVLPGYGFLNALKSPALLELTRRAHNPDRFADLARLATDHGMSPQMARSGINIVSKIVLHTGRDVDELNAEDIFEYRAAGLRPSGGAPAGTYAAWDLLAGAGILPQGSLKQALRHGQRPTTELVDRYRLTCRPIRDLLIRYLGERRPGVDYGTFRGIVGDLAGRFWADIEHHHPGIDNLHLPDEVAQAWKQRMAVVTAPDGSTRPRRNRFDILVRVRGFYLDIREWALEDASWAAWVVPCPVRRGDTDGMHKARQKQTAEMHQRVRERLPRLPVLVDAAERHLADQTALLAAATAAAIGSTFEHAGSCYRRVIRKSYTKKGQRPGPADVLVDNTDTGERIELLRSEDEAFWAWAIIEVLRHTGIRSEELLEITHLALVSYRVPDTGEVVPLLQIVPSKRNEERLLLVSPELASVLATIIGRLRHRSNGTVPLVTRYDEYECVTGPALPHLFQRKHGWRDEVISRNIVMDLLNATLARTGLRDAARHPLRYTPHDFRRIFATDAVTGGLPVHIVAKLLGHQSLTTTEAYTAIFQDHLIRTYRAFLDRRRSIRPEAEYREPTADEWREFNQHFAMRKVELGTCGRPYGSPCKHEHVSDARCSA